MNKVSIMSTTILVTGFYLDLIWTIKQPLNRYESRWKTIYSTSIVMGIIFFIYIILTNTYIPDLAYMEIGEMHKYYHWAILNILWSIEGAVMFFTFIISLVFYISNH